MSAKTILLSFIFAALPLGGCQAPMTPPRTEEPAAVRPLVWPQPPQQARIRFIRTVARPADLGIEPSFFGRLFEAIVGKEESWLIRPTGVIESNQKIFIADAGAQALWILDRRAGKFQKIQEAGGEHLASPVALAAGSANRVYLADSYLAKIFLWDSEGKLIRTISDSNFHRPAGLAYDRKRDRLYVADSAAHRIWILSGEGTRLGEIGRRGEGNGEFNFPTHVAVDGSGNLYVTDSLNFRLQMFNANGKFIGKFGRHGDSSGDFASPKGVAVDSEGHVYVVDALFDAVQIFDRSGRYLLTFGERGLRPGQFWLPNGIFIDGQDRIYVADSYNQRIQTFQYLRSNEQGAGSSMQNNKQTASKS